MTYLCPDYPLFVYEFMENRCFTETMLHVKLHSDCHEEAIRFMKDQLNTTRNHFGKTGGDCVGTKFHKHQKQEIISLWEEIISCNGIYASKNDVFFNCKTGYLYINAQIIYQRLLGKFLWTQEFTPQERIELYENLFITPSRAWCELPYPFDRYSYDRHASAFVWLNYYFLRMEILVRKDLPEYEVSFPLNPEVVSYRSLLNNDLFTSRMKNSIWIVTNYLISQHDQNYSSRHEHDFSKHEEELAD